MIWLKVFVLILNRRSLNQVFTDTGKGIMHIIYLLEYSNYKKVILI
jgi:hypothetical protein